jgi:hypothetical protein
MQRELDAQQCKVRDLEASTAAEKEAKIHALGVVRIAEERAQRVEDELRKAADALAAR